MGNGTDATAAQGLLDWMHAMLVADSLEAVAALAAQGPSAGGETLEGSLVLADPAYELRHLAFGDDSGARPGSRVTFVDSLVGVAPQCASLHAPWSGEYRGADHALLLPAGSGVTHLLLLPLERRSQLVGVHCLGGRGRVPTLASLPSAWGRQVAAATVATLERLFDRARLLRFGVTDPLTGWHSRRYLHARLCEELARCRRDGAAATCLVVDADHLRRVNEHLGTSAGDRALLEIGARLEGLVRSSDTVAHLGGDQFAVLLPGATASQAVLLADRIRAAMRSTPVELAPGVHQTLTVSIGVAAAQPGGDDDRKAAADQWLADAEAALHRAKRRGSDGCEVSTAVSTSAPGTAAPRPPQ